MTDANGDTWTAGDFDEFDVPGSDAGLRGVNLTIVLADTAKTYRNLFAPRHLGVTCDYYEFDLATKAVTLRESAVVVALREKRTQTFLTLSGPLSVMEEDCMHLALPEFSEAGDDFLAHAEASRGEAFGGTPIGS